MSTANRTTISESTILNLVGEIYEAALNPAHWQTVLERIAAAMDAPRALLFSQERAPEDGGTWAFHNLGPDMMQPYIQHYCKNDLWFQGAEKLGVSSGGEVFTGELLIDDSTLYGSEFYNDYLQNMGMFRLCTAIIDDGARAPIPRVHLSLYRPKKEEPFPQEVSRSMAALNPHLKRALAFNYHLLNVEKPIYSIFNAVGCLGHGTLVVDEHCRLVRANTAAEHLLAQDEGIRLRNGVVEFFCASEKKRFIALVADACDPWARIVGGTPNSMLVSGPARSKKLRLTVTPIGLPPISANLRPRAHAAVFISRVSEPPDNSIESTGKRYRLTAAELRVVQGILDGLPIKEIALRLGISANTVHSQLNAIYAKTNVHRQTELMKLFMTES